MSEFVVSTPLPRSPLDHRDPIGDAESSLGMMEVRFVNKITIRGQHDKIVEPVREATGLDLPAAPGAIVEVGERRGIWLAPDEWLVLAPDGEQVGLIDALQTSLSAVHSQVVDVSDYETVIALSGTKATDTLSRLCTLDLHGDALGAGHATRTRLAKASVTLIRDRSNGVVRSGYQILVRASMADYLWCLLAEAGLEYDLPVQEPRGGEPRRY